MLRPTAKEVQSLENYTLRISFDDGEVGIFDVKPYILGSWFEELKNKNYFSLVKTNGFSVEWPNGQDICPDDLYYNSIKINLSDRIETAQMK